MKLKLLEKIGFGYSSKELEYFNMYFSFYALGVHSELISQRYLDDSLKINDWITKKYHNDERLLNALAKCY